MAAQASGIALPRQSLLGVLLDATLPATRSAHPALRPLWADEAIQRAHDMIGLVAELERGAPLRRADRLAVRGEHALAVELAAAFRALSVDDDGALPCSGLLRTIVHDLVELFGPVAGQPRLRSRIERLALPACQRRALVLAGSTLVTHALLRSADADPKAEITVTLGPSGPGSVCLRIVTERERQRVEPMQRPDALVREMANDVAADLALLLDGNLVHRRVDGSIVAALNFPVSAAGRDAGGRRRIR
jgi:hypothetical protein